MKTRDRRLPLTSILVLLATIFVAGCSSEPAADTDEPEPAAEEPAAEPAGRPAVHFASIEDGGTYTSPLEIVFAVDNFDIVPVEDPMVVREGEGHYHLAVDVECAAAGEVIVQGNPSYIHFGDGSDRITMQFEPGQHSLCLQVADGEHRVLDGPDASDLTRQISITIEESAS